MPAVGTPSASSDRRAWVLPTTLRPAFQQAYGPIYTGAEFHQALRAVGVFATCGDRVTAEALDQGTHPLVGVVDFKTQRNEPVDPASFAPLALRRRVVVRNPAGMLTEELRTAIHEIVALGGGLVEVEGEEDLAVMPLIENLPVGSTVLYGIPGKGVCFLKVDLAAKDRVQALLSQMEPVTLGSSP